MPFSNFSLSLGAIGFASAFTVGAVAVLERSQHGATRSIAKLKDEVRRFHVALPGVREVRAVRVYRQSNETYIGEIDLLLVDSEKLTIKQIVISKGADGAWSWQNA
ncbi:MAG: hypothetical protein U1E28_19165 [Beijerinckiaceae bacterium]